MSDLIKHECGIAMLRLLKPLDYYIGKYGTWSYGLEKMYLMMEKQHNRGQDGAGIAGIKLKVQPGRRYIFRQRSNRENSIQEIFNLIYSDIERIKQIHKTKLQDADFIMETVPL
jgi:amidophosphoribosyltransferase